MSYFTPSELPDHKYYIFGKEGGKCLADEYDLPFLGQIPLVQSIREGGDAGLPEVLKGNTPSAAVFKEIAQEVARQVSVRNAELAQTKVVEITRT